MGRDPLMVRVDTDVQARFREFVHDEKGDSRGQLGREVENALIEYMDNDRSARVETKMDRLSDDLPEQVAETVLEKMAERERRKQDANTPQTPTPGSQTQQRLDRIVNDLPADTSVSEAMLETPIEEYGGSSPKTVKKYKRLLAKRGHVFEHPIESDQYVTSARSLAVICENSGKIGPRQLDAIVGQYESVLGENWYLEALPDAFITGNELKYDQVADSLTYREENGLLDGERGFQ